MPVTRNGHTTVRIDTLAGIDRQIRPYPRPFGEDPDGEASGPGHVLTRPMPRTIALVEAAAAQAHLVDSWPALAPYWAGPYLTGKRLDVGAYLRHEDRCLLRRATREIAAQPKHRRVIVQLGATAGEGISEVFGRALAGLALVCKLAEQGDPATLVAVWASVEGDGNDSCDPADSAHIEISNPSAALLARLATPLFFRSWIFGARTQTPILRYNHGAGLTIKDPAHFARHCLATGIAEAGDIIYDWTRPIDEQTPAE